MTIETIPNSPANSQNSSLLDDAISVSLEGSSVVFCGIEVGVGVGAGGGGGRMIGAAGSGCRSGHAVSGVFPPSS